MPKLVSVTKSNKPGKKWDFTFKRTPESKTTFTRSIGDATREDYTMHKNKTRRARYRQRHEKNLSTGDPTRAGYISYYVLWGDSTSFNANLAAYKKRFGL